MIYKMSKNDNQKKSAKAVKFGSDVSSGREISVAVPRDLFELYAARVGQVDFIHSMRIDRRKMFAEALDEARIAYDVYAGRARVKSSIR